MSDASAPPGGGSSRFGTALIGAVIGSVLTVALLLFLAPRYFAPQMVRDALLKDPQILVDTADALRDRQYEPALAANRAAIETPFASSWKGSAKPDVVLVEYHDYACTYCRASNPHIDKLVSEDKGLRVVYKDLPILGPDSVTAARVGLAAAKVGRFRQFHEAMYGAGRPSPQTIALAAKAAGVPPEPPAADPQIEAELKRNFQVAGQLGATGTPLFIVGDRVMNAAVGYEALKKAVEDARERSKG